MPKLTTCPCQHCNGHIQFDAASLSKDNNKIACPHCGLETILFVPPPPEANLPTPPAPPPFPNNPQPKVELAVRRPLSVWHWAMLLLAVFLIVVGGVYFGNRISRKEPITWEYSFNFYTTPTFEQSRMDSADVELYEASMNKDGNNGWEIVGFVPAHDGYHAVFKRPCAPVDADEMQARFDRAEHDWHVALSKK